MVTFGSLSETSTDFRKYTKQLYNGLLEQETGQSTGFKPCGFIELATNTGALPTTDGRCNHTEWHRFGRLIVHTLLLPDACCLTCCLLSDACCPTLAG